MQCNAPDPMHQIRIFARRRFSLQSPIPSIHGVASVQFTFYRRDPLDNILATLSTLNKKDTIVDSHFSFSMTDDKASVKLSQDDRPG